MRIGKIICGVAAAGITAGFASYATAFTHEGAYVGKASWGTCGPSFANTPGRSAVHVDNPRTIVGWCNGNSCNPQGTIANAQVMAQACSNGATGTLTCDNPVPTNWTSGASVDRTGSQLINKHRCLFYWENIIINP